MNSLSYQIKTLKLHNVVCQLYLNEVEKEDSLKKEKGDCQAVSQSGWTRGSPRSSVWRFLCPHVPAGTWFSLFRCCCSSKCVAASHDVLNLHFPND